MRYAGRLSSSDSAVTTKSWLDDSQQAASADAGLIDEATALVAASLELVTPAYVDASDATRAHTADVAAADTGYLDRSLRGVPNGVAATGADNYIPPAQLPTLLLDRPYRLVEATSVNLTAEHTVSTTTVTEYAAAVIEVADPGFPWLALVGGSVSGRCPTAPVSPDVGGGSLGRMSVLDSTGTLWGAGVTSGASWQGLHPIVAAAPPSAVPRRVSGPSSLTLYLSCQQGGSYVFSPLGLSFWALVVAAL